MPANGETMGDSEQKSARTVNQFRIVSIERVDPPENVSGGEWYRFSIEHDASPIDGMRSGTLNSVRQHLEEYVEKLNERASFGYSSYATRKPKK